MDLLTPLAVAGITRMRTRQDILQDLCEITVVERENKVCSIPVMPAMPAPNHCWHRLAVDSSAHPPWIRRCPEVIRPLPLPVKVACVVRGLSAQQQAMGAELQQWPSPAWQIVELSHA